MKTVLQGQWQHPARPWLPIWAEEKHVLSVCRHWVPEAAQSWPKAPLIWIHSQFPELWLELLDSISYPGMLC